MEGDLISAIDNEPSLLERFFTGDDPILEKLLGFKVTERVTE